MVKIIQSSFHRFLKKLKYSVALHHLLFRQKLLVGHSGYEKKKTTMDLGGFYRIPLFYLTNDQSQNISKTAFSQDYYTYSSNTIPGPYGAKLTMIYGQVQLSLVSRAKIHNFLHKSLTTGLFSSLVITLCISNGSFSKSYSSS